MSRFQYQPLASWDDFEYLCKYLFQDHWNTNVINLYGRKGCTQNGVDIYGYPRNGKDVFGIQCKGKEIYPEKQLSIAELKEEIKKAINFKPQLSHYIFATTARRCPRTQSALLELVGELAPPFTVEISFWDDLVELIDESQAVRDKYYGQQLNGSHIRGLFERVHFNDRINIVDIYEGKSDGERVFACQAYHLLGVVNENSAWLEFGGHTCRFPPCKQKIGHTRIDAKALTELIEEFYFGEQVDIFDVHLNFNDNCGDINMSNKDVSMSCLCYTENGKVYTDTGDEMNEYDSDAYFGICNYMLKLTRTILNY